VTRRTSLSCPICGLPVDLTWARQNDRTTHLVCEPPAPVQDVEPAAEGPAAEQPAAPARPGRSRPPADRPARVLQSLDDLVDPYPDDPADPLAWQLDALCPQTDPELFFPEKGGSTAEAKAVCNACPVKSQCLDYALETAQRFGIWGGMSERERRREADRRGLPVPPDDVDDDPIGPRTLRQHCERGGVLAAAGYELPTIQTYAARGEFIPPAGVERGVRVYETRDVLEWLSQRRHRRNAS
jgi:hypothetical protein